MRRALLRRRSERRSPESGTTTSPGRRPAGAPRTRVGVARAGTRSLREQDGRSRDRGRGPRALSPGPACPPLPPRRWRPHKDLALAASKSTWIVLAVVARPRRQSLSGPRGRTPAFGCSELEPQGGPAATAKQRLRCARRSCQ
nr:protein JTB isoform X2 [Peromyscus maniculatus bairdii]